MQKLKKLNNNTSANKFKTRINARKLLISDKSLQSNEKTTADSNGVNIVMTGGHAATTAIAVVQEVAERNLNSIKRNGKKPFKKMNLYWIGSKFSLEGSDIPSLEYGVLPKMGVNFVNIRTGRLQRKFTRWTIPSLVRIPFGFVDSIRKLKAIKPKVILSFGGFAAFPVVVCGKLLKIPIVLHEQTVAVGRANRMSALFADVITLARPESKQFFPDKNVKVVGNPLMKNILKVKPKQKIGSPPCLFITGGSRGAQSINNLIEPIINKLLKDFAVIHLTGKLDFERFQNLKKTIPENYTKRYTVQDMIDPALMHEAYGSSDIIVSRAGANTVAEILSVKRPAILIPLPFSYLDEQKKNAVLAQKFGLAEILEQRYATPDKLFETIMKVRKMWDVIVANSVNKVSPDAKASHDLLDVISQAGNISE